MRKLHCARVRTEFPFALPAAQRSGDAGLDLTIARWISILPGQVVQLPTNVAVAMPNGYFGLVLPRSSTLSHKGLYVSPGVIDNEYRGEIMVVARNMTDRYVEVKAGERIAQILVLPLLPVEAVEVPKLNQGARGDMGFGSTGGYEGV